MEVVVAAAITAIAGFAGILFTTHRSRIEARNSAREARESATESARLAEESAREGLRTRHALEEVGRLSGATGALRLQLFLSTRSFVQRLRQYYTGEDRPFPLRATRNGWPESEYHACGLLIFRLMRPIVVSSIIEQETFYRDLLLEVEMVDLLRFNHAAFEMLTGERLGEEFTVDEEPKPRAAFPDFVMERCYDPPGRRPPSDSPPDAGHFQRVRASYLRRAAAELVVGPDEREPQRRCMTHDEFLDRWEQPDQPDEHIKFHKRLEPVKATINDFWPMNNPVLWLRLVGYAYVCKWFYGRVCDEARDKKNVNYTPVELPLSLMLESAERKAAEPQADKRPAAESQAAAGREYLAKNANAYKDRFEELISTAL